MRIRQILCGFFMLAFIGYAQNFHNPYYSGAAYAQDDTPAQKNVKREKKKRMKEQVKADQSSAKRHMDIQTKATRKRMKQHLKEAKKNAQRSHR
jgi:hypothetical protein